MADWLLLWRAGRVFRAVVICGCWILAFGVPVVVIGSCYVYWNDRWVNSLARLRREEQLLISKRVKVAAHGGILVHPRQWLCADKQLQQVLSRLGKTLPAASKLLAINWNPPNLLIKGVAANVETLLRFKNNWSQQQPSLPIKLSVVRTGVQTRFSCQLNLKEVQ